MGSHIVHSYDRELELITSQVVEMGLLVKTLLKSTEVALKNPAESLVEEAKATDKKVNALDMKIEREAISVLALRQPMAIDLRFAVSTLKIAVIMERMGDLAKNAVKRAVRITVPVSANTIDNINQMVEIIAEMLEEVLEAFQQKDLAKVHNIILRDGEVDTIYRQLIDDIQAEMVKNPIAIPSYMHCIFAIKNIERIGDYVTKTAKIVHYIVSGERTSKPSKNPSEA